MAVESWGPQEWAAIAQAGAVVVALIALIWTATQYTESVKARELSAIAEVIREIGEEPVREARRWALLAKNLSQPSTLSDDEQRKARRVSVAYDRVGFFVRNSLLPRDEAVFQWHGFEIERLWNALRPLVEHVQRTEGRREYCQYFRYLGTTWVEQMKRTVSSPSYHGESGGYQE